MGMIGNQLAAGTALTIANDSFNGNGSTTAFTLSQSVSAVTDIEVLVDNVQQSPYDSSYSVSGTTLTFSGAPAAGTNNIYVIYNASKHISTEQVVPDDGSVVEAKLGAAAVTEAKLGNLAVTTAKLHDNAVSNAKLPAGSVINVATGSYITGASYSPSTSYVNTATLGTITTVQANSKILVITDVPVQTQKQNTIWSVALRSSIDSYASNLVIKHFVRYSTNDHTTGFTGMTYLHNASQAAGTSITYRYYVKSSNTSGGGWYCIDVWGVANTTGYAFTTNMLEIKQ